MGFADDLQQTVDDLFAVAGEPATYARGAVSIPVTAIFRPLTEDDPVSGHVLADSLIAYVRETEIHAQPFNRQPLQGDTVTRDLPSGESGGPRVQTFEVAALPTRDRTGRWKLTLQANVRLVP